MNNEIHSPNSAGTQGAGPSPDDVRAFWDFMQERFRTSVVNKQSAIEMRLVARALSALGIQSSERFLRGFTTTIGRRIYTPFEVGEPRGAWDLWRQIEICVHEHQHVVQHEREGIAFEISYLASRTARARWEAEALSTSLELHFWRYGKTPAARRLAAGLLEYGCRPEDVEVATQSLALSGVSVRQGAVLNEATRVALDWLDEHVPHLRAKSEV